MRTRFRVVAGVFVASLLAAASDVHAEGYIVAPMPGIPAPLIDPPTPRTVQPPRSWNGYGRPYRPAYRPRSRIVCDVLERCWREPWPGAPSGYDDGVRPPGWADDMPGRLQDPGRFSRPRSGVVCDQGTGLCYKNGRIDKSETERAFGERAGDRADDIRDQRGTGQVFVPERGVVCDTAKQACYDGRFKDLNLTRRYFGRAAADRLD